jgi:hypothetical protein
MAGGKGVKKDDRKQNTLFSLLQIQEAKDEDDLFWKRRHEEFGEVIMLD